jgi:hypothetical protein
MFSLRIDICFGRRRIPTVVRSVVFSQCATESGIVWVLQVLRVPSGAAVLPQVAGNRLQHLPADVVHWCDAHGRQARLHTHVLCTGSSERVHCSVSSLTSDGRRALLGGNAIVSGKPLSPRGCPSSVNAPVMVASSAPQSCSATE